jgi:hypothetical protein
VIRLLERGEKREVMKADQDREYRHLTLPAWKLPGRLDGVEVAREIAAAHQDGRRQERILEGAPNARELRLEHPMPPQAAEQQRTRAAPLVVAVRAIKPERAPADRSAALTVRSRNRETTRGVS